ncbi:hypothetical protein VD0002_g4356 [Verticillium dahliae]|nr:hypothetical protein VD0003_g5925 [Verticillium dahliae]PNH64242.1 hypothetical protein VD0002_g4356 [Verticillium dahliae]
MMERARREAPPNITIGELHSLLEATFGSQWTQDEEDELDRAMNDDPVVAALLDLSTGRHGGLWKATLYSVRETPDRRMSAPLRVSTRQHKALPQHGNMRNPNMNQMYCTHLILLVSHPIWERDIQALRQTIAFAVACQTKDQRPWNFENMVGGSVLAEFGRQAPASDGSRTIASLFRQVSNAAVGEKPPLVLLMDELAGDGDDDVEEGDFDDEAEVEYEVQLRHSASVIKVLDILVPRFKSSHTTSDWPAKQGLANGPPESLSIPPTRFSEEHAVEVPENPPPTQHPQTERMRTVEPIERLPPRQGSLHLQTPARTAIPPEEASIAAAAPAARPAKRKAASSVRPARPPKRAYKKKYTATNRTVAARLVAGPNAESHESHESHESNDLGDSGDSGDSMGSPADVPESEEGLRLKCLQALEREKRGIRHRPSPIAHPP